MDVLTLDQQTRGDLAFLAIQARIRENKKLRLQNFRDDSFLPQKTSFWDLLKPLGSMSSRSKPKSSRSHNVKRLRTF